MPLKTVKSTEVTAEKQEIIKEVPNFVSCVYCSHQFTEEKWLHIHVEKAHRLISTFKCYLCYKYFLNKAEEEKHQEEAHHDAVSHECIYCSNSVFKNKQHLHDHVEDHHSDVLVQCRIGKNCYRYFHTEKEKAEHERFVHKNTWHRNCIYCNKKYMSWGALFKHINTHHSNVCIKCKFTDRCGAFFRNEQERAEHIQQVHLTDNKSLCPVCLKMVSGTLRKHLKLCHDDHLVFKCSFQECSMSFLSEESLNDHKKNKHKNHKHLAKCTFCNKNILESTMRKHINNIHQAEIQSTYKCTFNSSCLKFFLTETDRDEHVRTVHNKPRETYKCVYCNKALERHQIYEHIRIWHSDVQIKCPLRGCNHYFLSQLECDQHFFQQHQENENKKMFKCSECVFSSATVGTLRRHKALMHGNSKILCPKCPKVFCSQCSLDIHMKNAHAALKMCEHCNLKYTVLRHHQRSIVCTSCHDTLGCVVAAKLHRQNCSGAPSNDVEKEAFQVSSVSC